VPQDVIFVGGKKMVKSSYETERMKKIPFTGIRRVMEQAIKLEAEGKSVVHFEIGQPDFDTPEHIKQAAKDALDKGIVKYTSNFGLLQLRQKIAEKLQDINNLRVDPNTEIMVTVGGEEAVGAILLSLLDPGDEVLVTDPGYIPYYSLVHLASGIPVPVPLIEEKGYAYDYDALERAVTPRTRMLILNSPNNPTGAMFDKDNLAKLAEFCERNNLLVLADEAYEQMVYDGEKHVSFATLPNMKERTITVQSFSKTYSMTGWRIGYIVASKEINSVIVRAHQNLVLCATSFAQAGAIAALTGSQEPLKNMVNEFSKRRNLLYQGLNDLGIPCHKPQGAFYLFPNISEFGMGSSEFADYLLSKYGVASVPGVEFGQCGEGHLRISYANSYANCQEGLRRIQKAVEELRSRR
jgi:aspartate/methionine/tyrosine aminotransferase